jgi:hypothetical protein
MKYDLSALKVEAEILEDILWFAQNRNATVTNLRNYIARRLTTNQAKQKQLNNQAVKEG